MFGSTRIAAALACKKLGAAALRRVMTQPSTTRSSLAGRFSCRFLVTVLPRSPADPGRTAAIRHMQRSSHRQFNKGTGTFSHGEYCPQCGKTYKREKHVRANCWYSAQNVKRPQKQQPPSGTLPLSPAHPACTASRLGKQKHYPVSCL